jgi:2,4-dienoyl-CoA reductase-like NADH-dependent reductase (Old Yellow Enzyme family)
MFDRPGEQGTKGRLQALAQRRDAVLDRHRRGLQHPAGDDAVAFEAAQRLRARFLGDAVERALMAPMTRSFAREGIRGYNVAAGYRRRAEAEVGLILSEGTVVDRPAARNDPGIPFFHGEAADEAVADTIAAFARAAADAKRLGFDTFEIHGAHGYLIDQFFWSGTNLRQDRFGGATLAERSRFAAEVLHAMRAAVGLGSLVHRLERNEFDLIAVGRALLSDPAWVTKVRDRDLASMKNFSPAALAELV